MRIAMAQLNATVGALEQNTTRILEMAARAHSAGCELLITPELAVTGYLPMDLVLKRHFIAAQRAQVHERLAAELQIPALVGFIDEDEDGHLYNSAAYIADGKVQQVIHKSLLPTYDVFDEWRYFRPGVNTTPLMIGSLPVGVTICEDIWDDEYELKVVRALADNGAKLIVNLSSSPYRQGKQRRRVELCRKHAMDTGLALLYCNMVGAQEELIFDGSSLAVDGQGRLIASGASFEEDLLVIDPFADNPELEDERDHDGSAELFQALSFGIAEYFRKSGFSRAVIGLSGGIDSALTACLAVDALGPGNVAGLAMPSQFTAELSNSDARELALNLGMEFHVFPIEASVVLAQQRYEERLGPYRNGLTRENLQARERGKILMEFANDRDCLVLATGNKTEYALGYSTLYGDMCGGLAPIGDLSKPQVYALSHWYNSAQGRVVIPAGSLSRAPSAELRADQVDPFDYDRTGPLVDAIVVEHMSSLQLRERGYTDVEIEETFRLIRMNEYKRWQAAPILRVTKKAFGSGRRMPLVNWFAE